MSGFTSRLVACGFTVLICWAESTTAQVQQRADGRLNDVNPLIGSGGLNQPAPRQPINTGNLIVTGNVTGGRFFRGFSPIRNSNEFFVGIPSATLSDFRRDSVGTLDIPSGFAVHSLQQPRPFFSRSRTITNIGAIEQGLNVPGMSVPQNIYKTPQVDSKKLRSELISPITPDIADTRVPTASGTFGSLPDVPERPYSSITQGWSDVESFTEGGVNPRIAHSSLFSSNPQLRKQQLEELLDPLGTLRARLTAERSGLQDAREDLRTDTRIDTRISASPFEYAEQEQAEPGPEETEPLVYGLPGAAALLYGLPSEPPIGEQVEETATGTPVAGETAPPQYDAVEDAKLSAERYSEWYQQQRRADLLQSGAADIVGGATPTDRGPEVDRASGAARNPTLDRTLPGQVSLPRIDAAPPKPALMQHLAEIYAERITTFVGRTDTPLNRQLRVAEQLTQSGHYFRAVGQYEIAGVMAPWSPLPDIGRAHALIGAGQYYTAVRFLERGIKALPGVANFRIDLKSFIPDLELLDRRRADLEKRLADRENPEFRFLLGYMEYYMGLEEYGLENLDKAAAQAPTESFIARFPELLSRRADLILKESEAGQSEEEP